MTSSRNAALFALAVAVAGCNKSSESGSSFQTVGRQPDVAPVMLNKELPFRYPPALFAQKVQGNVTLRIFINSKGEIVPDSTHVAETSGYSALDSAAVKGSRELKFEPAKTQEQPVPVSILLPVFFRYPGAPPLPGDSILQGRESVSSTTPPALPTVATPPADTAKKSTATAVKPVVKKTTKNSAKTRKRATSRHKRRR